MARIKIEDLPVADHLTPEQEELIQGAGLRSFRPTFEALEGREMMDAGLGHGLPLPVARPALGGADPAGQVRLLDSPAPGAAQAPRAALPHANLDQRFDALGRQGLPQGQLQSAASQADGQKIFNEVKDRYIKQIYNTNGNRTFDNPWWLRDIKDDQSGFEIN